MMGSSCLQSLVPALHFSKIDSSKNLIFLSSSSVASKNLIFLSSSSIATPKSFPFLEKSLKPQRIACSSTDDTSGSMLSGESIPSNFCIIEGPETVEDFVQMQLQEIQDNIRSRRNKIFLLMEEIRRLRVHQRIKSTKVSDEMGEQENEMPDIPSSIPFLSHVMPKTLKQLYLTSFSFVSGIIVFGGLLAPIRQESFTILESSGFKDPVVSFRCKNPTDFPAGKLELKLGLGGTSYEDFICSLHLPIQLSQVDPIVASFSGGTVGVISALTSIEVNNVQQQAKKRCKYCHGTGYLACARCGASGTCLKFESSSTSVSIHQLQGATTQRCQNCSGSGKVMCTTCLCTGMAMASEHDPRIDPFD